METRHILVWLHRWTGLLMTAFLVVVGLTGSLLAYNSELERVFAPQLFAGPHPGVAPLNLATLAERAQALVPGARVLRVQMSEPDQVLVQFEQPNDAAPGSAPLGFTEFFLDPYTGAELGRRIRSDLSQGTINLMPFIYDLHWRLALGATGQLVLGVVAIAWTIDCFVAFYLTLPVSAHEFWRRWGTAWRIKRNSGFYRLNFDLHRASGLWLWPLLFVFAWSSVMFNIRPVYEWPMGKLFDYRSRMEQFMQLSQHPANETPRLDWRAAQSQGERLMAEEAARLSFSVAQPISLMYFDRFGVYIYSARGSRDIFERSPKGGDTAVMFDGDSGALMDTDVPTGQRLGNTIESWLYALHMSRVFGRPYQLFVCVLGVVVAGLGVTGVYIWWRKRRARQSQQRPGSITTKPRRPVWPVKVIVRASQARQPARDNGG